MPHAKTVLYADDTNILITGKNLNALQENVNNSIMAAQTWFSTNNLIINTDKTFTMSFNNYQKLNPLVPNILFNHKKLPNCVTTKLNTGYYIIKQLQKITNTQTLRTV
jgi:hypothetical protein